MSQLEHLSRLDAADAQFLAQENEGAQMHIGGVMIFEGPMPDIDLYKRHILSRIHLVPRYRQRLVPAPLQTGRPFWADDPEFNISYHVRDAALPAPGNDEQLERMVARIYSQRLDRRKPLWEMWLIDGLSGGRFAMILKTHHAIVDGIAGIDIATVLLDATSDEVIAEPEPWNPRPLPTQGELLELAAREALRMPLNLARRAVDAVRDPETAREDASEFAGGLFKAFSETMDAAPRTPLNTEITQHRRYKLVRNSIDDFKEIKTLLDTTVNDVVLTVVSDALGRWLRSRYYPTDGLKLRGLVPVSTRPRRSKRGAAAGHAGNELQAMRGALPVQEMDVLERLNYVKNSMDHLKRSNQAVAADALIAVQNFAPPTILAQASRLNFSTRLFNLLVTNVPGPQIPLYLLGRQMLDAFPAPFLARGHALAVAAMSYNGRLNFGLLGDYDAMSDIQVIADGMSDSRDDLLEAAATVKSKARQFMRNGPAVAEVAEVAEVADKSTARAKAELASNGAVTVAAPIKKAPATKKAPVASEKSTSKPKAPVKAKTSGKSPAKSRAAAKTNVAVKASSVEPADIDAEPKLAVVVPINGSAPTANAGN